MASLMFLRRSTLSLGAGWVPEVATRARFLHGFNGTRYHINYHKLKDIGALDGSPAQANDILESNAPTTVTDNVKNVQGWKGAAKRGFMATYPDCIHQITSGSASGFGPLLTDWYTKVLTHHLGSSVLPDRQGLLVPISFYQLKENLSQDGDVKHSSREEMRLAHALGWAVELLRASHILASQTMALQDPLSRPLHHSRLLSHEESPASESEWRRKHNLGTTAFNDALLLRNAIFSLLSSNFKGSQSHVHLMSDFNEAMDVLNLGLVRMFKLSEQGPGASRLPAINVDMFKTIVRANITHVKFILPVKLALHLGGFTDTKAIEQAISILNDVGYLSEVTCDFVNCFFESAGKDITDGRLTWLIVNAYQRGNKQQKVALQECYGHDDEEKAAKVKEIYHDLKLQKMCWKVIEENRMDLFTRIQQMSTVVGIPPKFFFALLDYMDNL